MKPSSFMHCSSVMASAFTVIWSLGCEANGSSSETSTDGVSTSSDTSASSASAMTVDVPTTGLVDTSTTTSGDSSGTTVDAVEPPSECKLQDGNCEDGFKCVPYGQHLGDVDRQGCFPLPDRPDAVGEPCTNLDYDPLAGEVKALDSCGEGAFCWEGICAPACKSDAFFCPQGFDCIEALIPACIAICDPLIVDLCDNGETCQLSTGGFFSCGLAGSTLPLWSPCGGADDCNSGLVCVPPFYADECNGGDCCSPVCDLQGGACPGMMQVCVKLFDVDADPAYDDLGICMIPQ